MSKLLFLLHGMGTPGSNFKTSFKEVVNQAMKSYPKLADRSIDDYFDVVAVDYNKVFDNQRKAWRTKQEKIGDKLESIGGTSLGGLVSVTNSIQEDLVADEFFATHVLDVLLYRFTFLGEQVRVHVAKKIVGELRERARACLLYTSPSPRDRTRSRMPSSA